MESWCEFLLPPQGWEMPLQGCTTSLPAKGVYWSFLLPLGDRQGGTGHHGHVATVSLSCSPQMGSCCRPGSWGNPLLLQLGENIPLQSRRKKSAIDQVLCWILAMASPTLWHCPASQEPRRAAGESDLAGKEPWHWAQAALPPRPWQGEERAVAGLSQAACPVPAGDRPVTLPCPLVATRSGRAVPLTASCRGWERRVPSAPLISPERGFGEGSLMVL